MRVFLSLGLCAALIGCAAHKPQFDANTTPRVSESFGKNRSAIYRPVSWKAIEGWRKDDHEEALAAFVKSCQAATEKSPLFRACEEAKTVGSDDPIGARIFFETHFQPYEIIADGKNRSGLITGYYVPTLNGSRQKSDRFLYPIYRKPRNFVVVDLAAFGFKGKARGFVGADGSVTPYRFDRAAIETNATLHAGDEIFWTDDPIGLFFMHIQGSGLIRTEDGRAHLVGYAAQNGFPYYAIGKYLVESGEIDRDDLSMQSIREWLLTHKGKMWEVMRKNRSFIFFEEGNATAGAMGSLGVALSAKRSIAVDPSFIPLGSPVFLSSADAAHRLSRLTIAQDTGGAIKGANRADFFWGEGTEASENAGKMKQQSLMWILLPKN